MPRTHQDVPESQPPTASGGVARQESVPDADVETLAPPASAAADNALFRALLAAGADAVTAYTAVREMESTAGQNVVVQLGAQVQALGGQVQALATQVQALATTLDRVIHDLAIVKAEVAEVKAEVAEVKSDVAGVKTEVAVLTKEVRLIWLLLIPTLTAVLIRLFTG